MSMTRVSVRVSAHVPVHVSVCVSFRVAYVISPLAVNGNYIHAFLGFQIFNKNVKIDVKY